MGRRCRRALRVLVVAGWLVCPAVAEAPPARCVLEFETNYQFDKVGVAVQESGGLSFQGVTKNEGGKYVGFTLIVPPGTTDEWHEFGLNMMATKGLGSVQLDVPDAKHSRRFASGNPEGDVHLGTATVKIRRTADGWQAEATGKVYLMGKLKGGKERLAKPFKLTFENVRQAPAAG